jgi:hypothetical protein
MLVAVFIWMMTDTLPMVVMTRWCPRQSMMISFTITRRRQHIIIPTMSTDDKQQTMANDYLMTISFAIATTATMEDIKG